MNRDLDGLLESVRKRVARARDHRDYGPIMDLDADREIRALFSAALEIERASKIPVISQRSISWLKLAGCCGTAVCCRARNRTSVSGHFKRLVRS